MVNFLSVMVDLADKIAMDKVQPHYIFHKNCRVDVKDSTRLKMDSAKVEEFAKTLGRVTSRWCAFGM